LPAPPSRAYVAFQRLVEHLESLHDTSPLRCSVGVRARGKQKAEPNENIPLVVLAFDEAHTTTKRQEENGEEWSVFNELRHVLRRLRDLPLFTLFLSTTSKISQFTSAVGDDLSKRIVDGDLVVIPPYTDLGFDPLASKIAVDGEWDLERLTSDDHISSMGRPLCVSLLPPSVVVIYEIMIDSQPGIWKARVTCGKKSLNLRP